MKKGLLIKTLALGIIILFIAVAVAPSINANVSRLPVKSKLVETAVRIHRAKGITPYTVKLTEKESDEVDRIFDNIKVSLDSAVTDEEIDEIFNDAVVSLYELGLFPKHMTIKEAQQLIVGESQNPSVRSSSGNLEIGDENFDCQIVGRTTETVMFDLPYLMGELLAFLRFLKGIGTYYYGGWDYNFPFYKGEIGLISLGRHRWDGTGYAHPSSNGWVWTDGSNGVVEWKGVLYGNLGYEVIWEYFLEEGEAVYMGVADFEGLFIDIRDKPPCYLGNAEHVSISYSIP